jgi:hypothetical protein
VYGRANSANERTLDLIINAEINHWGKWKPDVIFLVGRTVPVTPLYNIDEWKYIVSLYETLADREHDRCRVERISNDGTIDETDSAVTRIVREILPG